MSDEESDFDMEGGPPTIGPGMGLGLSAEDLQKLRRVLGGNVSPKTT